MLDTAPQYSCLGRQAPSSDALKNRETPICLNSGIYFKLEIGSLMRFKVYSLTKGYWSPLGYIWVETLLFCGQPRVDEPSCKVLTPQFRCHP